MSSAPAAFLFSVLIWTSVFADPVVSTRDMKHDPLSLPVPGAVVEKPKTLTSPKVAPGLPAASKPVPSTSPVSKPVNVYSTESQLQGYVHDMHWICSDSKTVVLRTSDKVVYLSFDEGKTWQDQTHKLFSVSNSGEHATGPTTWNSASILIQKIVLHKPDPKLFVLVSSDAHFITHDCGKTFRAVRTHLQFDDIAIHPKVVLNAQFYFFCLHSSILSLCFSHPSCLLVEFRSPT
jgi:hypothetical protein